MKRILLSFLLLLSANGLLLAQPLYRLDGYAAPSGNTLSKAGMSKANAQASAVIDPQELQAIEELTATIEGLLLENGELTDIAKERNVRCLKVDADIPTFLKFTSTQKGKKEIANAGKEALLVRFSFFSEQDFELAKSVDFSIVNQLPQLKYVVLYVDPSVYKHLSASQQQEQIERMLKSVVGSQIDATSLKIFYRIPRGS